MKKISFFLAVLFFVSFLHAEDGYRLWLRYDRIDDPTLLQQYSSRINAIFMAGTPASPALQVAQQELVTGLQGLLAKKIQPQATLVNGSVVIGTPQTSALVASLVPAEKLLNAGNSGYVIFTATSSAKNITLIAGNSETGVLYGVFSYLRLLQTHQPVMPLSIVSAPTVALRILNHWDNLNRSVERGYAGISIWDWHKLPDYLDRRYTDYARANASVGINGTVLTNVNSNALTLTKDYIIKAAALANVFRPYGIKVYLTPRFSAPIELGKLKTADPLDPAVQDWWKQKVTEIYQYIPDFGGFLVKANSEGQPGPQNYGRSHADGANMLADAMSPHGGIVIWRAFVYSNETPDDRFKQAYNEFKPLDGKFRKNVLVQVKNGPIDFQPREPFHPLFGAMPHTPIMMGVPAHAGIPGFATHLVYGSTVIQRMPGSGYL